jgi:ankyrin repeat protein
VYEYTQGQPADAADYDGRTALMLAAGHGHVSTTRMLLEVGADAARRDDLGGTAMLGAAKGGHDGVLTVLQEHGARCGCLPEVERK